MIENKNKIVYQQGFSLAEALITLTLVSLILAAVIPVTSKRSITSDSMWKYASNNSDIFYGEGESQTAVIGANGVPSGANKSKLVIVTPNDSEGSGIQKELISFYEKTSSGVSNVGKISFDNSGNVAIGKNTLSKNKKGGSDYTIPTQPGIPPFLGGGGTTENPLLPADPDRPGMLKSYDTKSAKANQANIIEIGSYGYGSTAVGNEALTNNTGRWNTAVGSEALDNNTTGKENVAIGAYAGSSNTTGSSNVFIGAFSGSGNTHSKLFIGQGSDPLIWGDFSGESVKINGKLSVKGKLYANNGTLISSDSRLKNVGKDYNKGLEDILRVKNKTFTYKDDKEKRLHHGVIAQELQKIMPDAVIKGPQDLLYIDINEIVFTLVNSVKQLHIKIVNNKNEINRLNKRIKYLEEGNRNLETRLRKLENSKN